MRNILHLCYHNHLNSNFMKSRIITLALLVLCIISCKEKVVVDNTQHANPGRIDLYENFKSAKFRPSNVLVWVPDDYNTNTQYAVLYMHDAQMLFDETTTWNKQTWNIDSIAASLQRNDRCRPFIIVGIENHPTDRLTEYLPTKIAYFLSTQNELMQALNRSKLVGDEYLEFIVNELKPFIDSTYSTLPDAENTAIMGSMPRNMPGTTMPSAASTGFWAAADIWRRRRYTTPSKPFRRTPFPTGTSRSTAGCTRILWRVPAGKVSGIP